MPFLQFGDRDNVLAVRADNSHQPNSRWYAGSGIYRRAWLLVAHRSSHPPWGTQVTTPVATAERAVVAAAIQVVNGADSAASFTVVSTLLDRDGKEVQSAVSEQSLWSRRQRRDRPGPRDRPSEPLVD